MRSGQERDLDSLTPRSIQTYSLGCIWNLITTDVSFTLKILSSAKINI